MNDYRAMLQSRHQAALLGMSGMEPWPVWKAARLFAIEYVFGNNECFTLSSKFNIDREYIQHLYHINGGETPDQEFVKCLKQCVRDYEAVKDKNDPAFREAEKWIKQMYDFQLYV